VAKPEMARTAAKSVERKVVLRAPDFVAVGISGALFFGSFLLGKQKK
jgi:hypothetical protein